MQTGSWPIVCVTTLEWASNISSSRCNDEQSRWNLMLNREALISAKPLADIGTVRGTESPDARIKAIVL
jgi:hypothetical protein